MSERREAQLLRSDTAAEGDGGDEDHAGLLSKSGLILIFGIGLGSYIGGTVSGMVTDPSPLSEVGIRALFMFLIVLGLDRVFGVQREWWPYLSRLKQRFS